MSDDGKSPQCKEYISDTR